MLAGETGGKKRYRLLGNGAEQLGPPDGESLLDLAGGRDTRRDGLEAAIDDVEARLGKDAVQSGRVFTASTDRNATRRASVPRLKQWKAMMTGTGLERQAYIILGSHLAASIRCRDMASSASFIRCSKDHH